MAAVPEDGLPDGTTRELAALSADRPLTVPLLIRGSFDSSPFGLLVAIAALLFLGGCFALLRSATIEPALLCWAYASAAGIPALVIGLYLRRQRRWLEVTLTG